MKKIKIYLSGPMTGMPNLNFERFDRLRDRLIRHGFEVVSPADLDRKRGQLPYEQTLRDDLRYLLDCDAIFLMEGWEKSHGANVELFVAKAIGLKIIFE